MVDPDHVALSITRQCRLVSIARSSFYYEGTGESPLNLQLLRRIDEQFSRDAVFRLAADDALAALPGHQGQPQARPAFDAALGPAGDLPHRRDVPCAVETQRQLGSRLRNHL